MSAPTIRALSGPLALDRPDLVGRLRDALVRMEFTGRKIADVLGTEEEVLSRASDIPVHVRRLARHGAFGALIRLFILDLDVDADDVAPAVAPVTIDELARLGAVRREDGVVRPLIRIVPHDDLFIASDVRLAPGQAAAKDHVPGVHRPSVTLAHLTVRRPVRTFLDLGTGCGVEALLGARHAERVLGTDVNPRAIVFAAFNAQLNGVRNLELRAGSWFEPVGDARFEVIACNPPYVISPASEYLYRDSGLRGDSVSEQVVRAIPAHLEAGGFATIAISWIADPDGDAAEPVRRWVAGSGCDAWLLHYRTDEPLTTAAGWNQTEAGDPARYGELIDDWLAYYAELGVRGIAYGSLLLRRRDGENWFRVDPLPPSRLGPASDHILRIFAAQDFLQQAPQDDALLDATLAIVPTATVAQRVRFADGTPRVEEMTLSLEEGVGFQAGLDARVLRLLSQLDGKRTLREACRAAAEAEGVPASDLDRYVRAGLPVARRMFELGFLTRGV